MWPESTFKHSVAYLGGCPAAGLPVKTLPNFFLVIIEVSQNIVDEIF